MWTPTKLAAKTFREPGMRGTGGGANADLDTPGEVSAAEYITRRAAAFWTNKRMPATASNIATGIAHRQGPVGDANGGVPSLEHGQHRRHLLRLSERRTTLHRSRLVWET